MKTTLIHLLTELDTYLFTRVFVRYHSRFAQGLAGLTQSVLFLLVSLLEKGGKRKVSHL